MKDFQTFLREQKGNMARRPAQSSEAVGGIAGLGHVSPKEVVVTPGTNPTLIRSYQNSLAYDFSDFLSKLPSMDGDLMISQEDKIKLKDVLDRMPDSHRKRNLLKQAENTMTMPASETRTKNVQDIVNQINAFDTQAYGVPIGTNTNPEYFTPQKQASWSNR